MTNNNSQKIDRSQESLGPPPAQMNEFDFLIGNWTATTKGYSPDGALKSEHKGKIQAQHVNGGRMIFDDFTRLSSNGDEMSYAATLRTFCPETNLWEMTFLFSLGQMHTQSFRGQFINGEGHFDAVISLTPENAIRAKVRFFDIQKDSFEWSMENSIDHGKTWFLSERISAKRVS